ncbi:MAG: hypothetical protein N2Z65_02070 [Clostridiales bacterium]|nr:hypothetical protein [Clostridiales bacterium]
MKNYDPSYDTSKLIKGIDKNELKPVEIPCIVVKTQNNKIPCLLNELFNENGYNTVFISDNPCEEKNVAWVISSGQLNDNIISYITGKHEADIIIIGITDNNIKIKAGISCDIIFYEQTSSDYGISNGLDGILFEKKIKIDNRNAVENIYQNTVKILT